MLSDINGNALRWKPFNGTWINGKIISMQTYAATAYIIIETSKQFVLDGELVYRDPSGGLSILVMDTSTVKVLMTNTTFVS